MTVLVEEVGRGLGIVWIVINCAAWVMPMKVATWAKGEWRNARCASVLGEVRNKLIEWHVWLVWPRLSACEPASETIDTSHDLTEVEIMICSCIVRVKISVAQPACNA